MDRLKRMKDTLTTCIEGQLGNLQNVDAQELGEVVDMVKDLEEAIYYCTITKSMEEAEKKEKDKEHHYYTPIYYPRMEYPMMYRDMDRQYEGRMYYPGDMYYDGQPRDSQGRFMEDGRRNYNGGGNGNSSSGNSSSNGGSRQYREYEMPFEMRDSREGRSPMSRRTYMESKQMHKDKATKIKDLENYMKELSEDITEMIEDASPEERQILEKKMTALATKVGSLSNATH